MATTTAGVWKLQDVRDQILNSEWVTYNDIGDNAAKLFTWGNELCLQGNPDRCSPNLIAGVYQSFLRVTSGDDSFIGSTGADVVSWGQGICNQGGSGLNDRCVPVPLSPIQPLCLSQSTYYRHTIGITSTNCMFVFGLNDAGQLGSNNNVTDTSGVRCIGGAWCYAAAGLWHSLGIKTDGTLWAWGCPSEGALGNSDTTINYSSPVQIPGTTWSKVFAGDRNSFAIKSDGTLWAWGLNSVGELGNNNNTCYSSPIQIPGTDWLLVSPGYTTMALKTGGTLWGWGNGLQGQLQLAGGAFRSSPVQIPGTTWCDVATGHGTQAHVLALTTSNQLYTWGSNNCGKLGIGFNSTTCSSSNAPNLIPGTWCSPITAGYNNSAASVLGGLFLWGGNTYGQLALCRNILRSSPTQMPGTTWNKISAGCCSIFAHKTDGTLWSWGCNTGYLGYNCPFIYEIISPSQIAGTNWLNISSTGSLSLATKTDGTLWAWGSNNEGELGDNTKTAKISPIQIPGTNWKCATALRVLSVALKTDNTLWTWGYNQHGQLGNNTSFHRSSPVQIPGTDWNYIAKGSYCSDTVLASKTDGTLWAWGCNSAGQLGLSDRVHRSSPTQIPGTTWSKTVSSNDHVLALKTDGTLWVWGRNNTGQLSRTPATDYISSPVQVPGNTWNDVEASGGLSFGRKTDGTLWAWGANSNGELGINTATARSSPIQIPGTTWTDVDVGLQTTIGLKT